MSKIPVFDIGDTLFPTVRLYRKTVREHTGLQGEEIGNFNIFDPDSSERYLGKKGADVDGKALREDYVRNVERYMKKNNRFRMLRESSRRFGPIGVISDNWSYAEKLYRDIFREHSIEHKGIVISENVGTEKPDEKIFREFLGRREKKADRFVYFGNHAERDSGAKKVGMKFVFTREYSNFGTSHEGEKIESLTLENIEKEVRDE